MLPDTKYITHEPELIVGLTGTELTMVMVLSVLVCVAATLVLWVITPFSMPRLFSLCFLVALVAGYFFRRVIVKNKRDRPYGFYQQRLLIVWYKFLSSDAHISRDGYWDNQRDIDS